MSTLVSELRRRNVLRVAALYLVSAWLIAQITDVVSGLAGWPPSVGRAVLIILACGFPVALALAWLFEWTATGIRREDGAAGEAMQPRRQRIDYVIFAVLVVALGYFAANHDWGGGPPVAEASIAVLPFENRSALPEDRFFTDGVHDDLLTQLAKISSLAVISRTSVMRYRDSDTPIPDIGRELGVAAILVGGVQRSGGKVRINLQLIEAATAQHLWAEKYDRPLTAENVFEIQSEIATTIAGVLHAQLLPAEKKRLGTIPTQSLEAYDAYLLGRQRFATRDDEAMLEAETYYRRAIAADPEFALAYTGLADALSLLSEWDPVTRESRLADAEAAANRALDLDPGLGEAHTSLGVVRKFQGQPYEQFGENLRRGVELSPGSADARKWYGSHLAELKQYEAALIHLGKAAELDPMSPIIRVNLGGTLQSLGRSEAAEASFQKALEIDPGFRPALFSLAAETTADEQLVLLSNAWLAGAADAFLRLQFVMSYLDLDDLERAADWHAGLEATARDSVAALVGSMQLGLFKNEIDEAAEYAEKLLAHEDGFMPFPSRVVALRDVRNGDPGAALARYEQKYPALFTADPPIADLYLVASDIGIVLLESGDTGRAERLLRATLAELEATVGERGKLAHLPNARVEALLGEHDAALASLRTLTDAGWTWHWWYFLRQDLAFRSLHDDPRFVALVGEQRIRARDLLGRVREKEAAGQIVLPPGTRQGAADRR